MEKTKFCRYCGIEITESSKFCPSCGKDQYSSNFTASEATSSRGKDSINSEWIITLLLAWFFGVFGAHRFYNRRYASAVLMLFTLGGLGIWCIIDLIIVIMGKFKNAEGHPISIKG